MDFQVITLFPEMINGYCSLSIMKRAIEDNVITVQTTNPRDFAQGKHKRVDDTPYGGGAGMVLMCDPIMSAYESIKKQPESKTIMLTPQGKPYNQQKAIELAQNEQIIMLCGHYEGFDERIRESLDVEEISIGDFVLTGGELGALCVIDSVTRNLDGALGKIESAHYDSFSDGLLEHPHYTRPIEYRGMVVPEVLRSGNHKEIEKWRRKQEMLKTKRVRPDLFEAFKKRELSKQDKKILKEVLIETEGEDAR